MFFCADFDSVAPLCSPGVLRQFLTLSGAQRPRASSAARCWRAPTSPNERISHVVLWVGGIGHVPDKVPLILDSHGDSVKDSSGHVIPAGVHLRPFREKSWYFRNASHAIRVLHR